MQEFDKIYLVWRKGKGHERYAVGEIFLQEEKYVFQYLSKVKELQKEGFTVYTEFPDIDKKYTQHVLEIFGQRLTKSTRPDVKNLYRFWEVDETKTDDIFYMLGKTQALLATDNFELIPEYKTSIPLSFITEVVGLTHNRVEKDFLQIGDVLQIEKDLTNSHDSFAIKTFKNEIFIGYIKAIHCEIISKTELSKITATIKTVDQNGVVKRIFVKINIIQPAP